jgi:hypothetical protein
MKPSPAERVSSASSSIQSERTEVEAEKDAKPGLE